jgi:hypothetical protein
MLKLEIQKAHRIVIMSPSPIHLWPSCCKRFIFGQEDALEKDVDPACRNKLLPRIESYSSSKLQQRKSPV